MALVTSIFALGISIATPSEETTRELACTGDNAPASSSIEESFEDMLPGSSFETGRQNWTAPYPSAGSATAVAAGSSIMGRVEATSTSDYKMIYGFACATSYAPGVKIEFDMSTGETNKLRSAYILTSTTAGGYDPPSDYWFISFNYDGYIIAQNGDLADVRLQTYVANVIYHITIEFIGNMYTLDVSINGTKYTNGGAHFNTRFSRAPYIGAFQAHCRNSGAGWIAIDNLDASWINPVPAGPAYAEDFQSYANTSDLVGQGSWEADGANFPPSSVFKHPTCFDRGNGAKWGRWNSDGVYGAYWRLPSTVPSTGWFCLEFSSETSSTTGRVNQWLYDATKVKAIAISFREMGTFEVFDGSTNWNLFSYQANVVYKFKWFVSTGTNQQYFAASTDGGVTWITYDKNHPTTGHAGLIHDGAGLTTWLAGSFTPYYARFTTGSFAYGCYTNYYLDNISLAVVSGPNSPSITKPADLSYTAGQSGNTITWIITSASVGTRTHVISCNGTEFSNGTWIPSVPITCNVDGLAMGTYNYTIIALDGLGGIAQDSVIVQVRMNTSPRIASTVDVGNKRVAWVISDADTDITTYTVFRNGTAIKSGSWASSIPVIVDLSGLATGLYNFTIHVSDGLGGQNASMAMVMVVAIPPGNGNTPHDNTPGFTIIIVIIFTATAGMTLASAVAVAGYRKRVKGTSTRPPRPSRSIPTRYAPGTPSKTDHSLDLRGRGALPMIQASQAAVPLKHVLCPRCGNVSPAISLSDACCCFCGEKLDWKVMHEK
ncbi:MAG: hypothetical protein GYA24_08970 [Candidatus Lokiarchaeota archaeon]|nr:hypothetical protein [Candidatus Lokiarchaeota archaeon]